MSSKKIKVIIIDDEELICRMLMDFLNDYGINVEIAYSGNGALKMISEKPYDAAIVDMRLPDMVGDDLIIKANEIQPGIKYFVHTGSLDYVLSEELTSLGLNNDSIVYKPIKDMNKLYESIVKQVGIE